MSNMDIKAFALPIKDLLKSTHAWVDSRCGLCLPLRFHPHFPRH